MFHIPEQLCAICGARTRAKLSESSRHAREVKAGACLSTGANQVTAAEVKSNASFTNELSVCWPLVLVRFLYSYACTPIFCHSRWGYVRI